MQLRRAQWVIHLLAATLLLAATPALAQAQGQKNERAGGTAGEAPPAAKPGPIPEQGAEPNPESTRPEGERVAVPGSEQAGTEAAATKPATTADETTDETTDEAAAAQVATTGAVRPSKEEEPTADDAGDYADGSCKSPAHAWAQLLYWLYRDAPEPLKAAACFDRRKLSGTPAQKAKRAGELAYILRDAIDGKGIYVHWYDMPRTNKLPDNVTRYDYGPVSASFSGIYLKRVDGKWLFSSNTLAKIPSYDSALAGAVKRFLPDWARKTFLGVQLWSYGGIILLIFLALFFQKIVVYIIGNYVRRLLGQTKFTYLDTALRRAGRPIGGLVMALVFYIGFPMLLFPLRASQLAMIATQALSAYSGVWLAYRLIDVLSDFMRSRADATDTKLDDQLVPLVTKSLKVFVSVVGGIFILQNMNVDVGSLLAGLGLGGLAFALAAKDTVANFFGSVMIFIDKPFQIGDWIVMKDVEGVIEEVGFRTSRVRTFYNSLVTVPNAMVVNTTVDNYGRRQYRRYVTTLSLTYDTPPAKVQAFCEGVRAIIAGMPGMRKDYFLVEFKDFGASGLDIMVYCFMVTTSWNEELRTRTRLNLEIMRLADTLGVSFAFPTQTIHVETMAKAGEARASHSGPSDLDQLRPVVDGFGPGGEFAHPRGLKLSSGYYCDAKKVQAGDGDGEG